MAFDGSCHCGAVTFTVDADPPAEAIRCNCSHCRRKGFLLAFFPAEAFTLTTGEGSLTDYLFNRHKLAHRFCTVCGCQAHARGNGPDGKSMVAVNLNCVPSVDLDALVLQKVDGASF